MSSVLVSQPRSGEDTDEVAETNRSDLSLYVTRYLRRPRRHFLAFASLQRNEELGLDLRSLVAAAAAWNVVQSNTEILGLAVGMAVSREERADAEPSQENFEALLGLRFQSFKFDTPERDVDVTLADFPGLTMSMSCVRRAEPWAMAARPPTRMNSTSASASASRRALKSVTALRRASRPARRTSSASFCSSMAARTRSSGANRRFFLRSVRSTSRL